MNHIYAFHQTVRGASHVSGDIPCEDYSGSYSDENGKYHIAVVADGHGASECFRSSYGSKAITEITLSHLKAFAEDVLADPETEEEFYNNLFSDDDFRKSKMKELTDEIISDWQACVRKEYEENPPTEEELKNANLSTETNEDIAAAYGTTLIAALFLPKCAFMFQQGDGRCVVIYDDGEVAQPVPWDSRCVGRYTTSVCDADAKESVRRCIIKTEDRKVAACYLGSDGVEDAYRDTYEEIEGVHALMGGVTMFYKSLTCSLLAMKPDDFKQYLEIELQRFSEMGSFNLGGSFDDVSVAGVVDIDAVKPFEKQFALCKKEYYLREKISLKQNELLGKSRKRGVLKQQLEDAEKAIEDIREGISQSERLRQETQEARNAVLSNIKKTEEELQRYRDECTRVLIINKKNKASNEIVKFMMLINMSAGELEARFLEGDKRLIDKREYLLSSANDLRKMIHAQGSDVLLLKNKLLEAEKNRQKAFEEYTDYNNACRRVESEIDLLSMRLAELVE